MATALSSVKNLGSCCYSGWPMTVPSGVAGAPELLLLERLDAKVAKREFLARYSHGHNDARVASEDVRLEMMATDFGASLPSCARRVSVAVLAPYWRHYGGDALNALSHAAELHDTIVR